MFLMGEQIMDLYNTKNFYIVDVSVLPEIIIKVMEAKSLIETGKEKTVQEAVSKVGISRSAYYKYKDSVFPFYDSSQGRTFTLALNLDNSPGTLSSVINTVAKSGANILTINQTIPIHNVANLTITIETGFIKNEDKNVTLYIDELFSGLQEVKGVQSFKILAME